MQKLFPGYELATLDRFNYYKHFYFISFNKLKTTFQANY